MFAVNCALTRRRQHRVSTVSLDESIADLMGPTTGNLKDRSPDPLAKLIVSESEEVLSRAIADLPSTDRAAFELKHITGLSGLETARILKMSMAALKSRLHRTRLTLRQSLSEYLNN